MIEAYADPVALSHVRQVEAWIGSSKRRRIIATCAALIDESAMVPWHFAAAHLCGLSRCELQRELGQLCRENGREAERVSVVASLFALWAVRGGELADIPMELTATREDIARVVVELRHTLDDRGYQLEFPVIAAVLAHDGYLSARGGPIGVSVARQLYQEALS